jgi:hypothetical protein
LTLWSIYPIGARAQLSRSALCFPLDALVHFSGSTLYFPLGARAHFSGSTLCFPLDALVHFSGSTLYFPLGARAQISRSTLWPRFPARRCVFCSALWFVVDIF